MILSYAIWLPIIFGLIILFTGSDNSKGYVRVMALIGALISLTVTLPLITGFDTSTASMQFVEQVLWVPRYDINYFLGVDGISVWFSLGPCFRVSRRQLHHRRNFRPLKSRHRPDQARL